MLGTLGSGQSDAVWWWGNLSPAINNSLTAWLNGLSGSNALLLGAILGFMCSFDLGGPVNKAAYASAWALWRTAFTARMPFSPAVKMVSAFTVTASTMLAPRLFKEFEIETGKSTWLLGLAGITEGAIPMAMLRSAAGYWFVCAGLYGNGRYCRCDEYRPFDTRCRHSLFYFMIMARAVLWRRLAGLARHWWGLQSRLQFS